MPISGKFEADFASFHTAVEAAETKLRSFETGSQKVENALARMTDAFTGRKLITEAELMASAIDRIGGTSKLTQDEIQRAGQKAAEAADKMRAMGIDVPPGIAKLAAEYKRLDDDIGGSNLTLGKLIASHVSAQAIWDLTKAGLRGIASAARELGEVVLAGAAVDDVAVNFERLAAQSGRLSSELLGNLRAGTRGTITDFELMKTANASLAAGLNLTETQFGTLAKGAFALAAATGTSVPDALEKMNSAMVTGQTRSVALLTGKIDLAKAEEAFAASLGKSVEQLSDAGKLEAARVAILDAVAAATARLGEQTEGLDTIVAQGKVTWQNFIDNLGRAVANSDTLKNALLGVRDIISDALGGSQQEIIATLTRLIDDAAISLIDLGKAGVTAAGFLATEFFAASKILGNVMQVIDGNRLAIDYLAKGINELAALTSFGDYSKRFQAEADRIDEKISRLLLTMKQRGDALQEEDRKQGAVSARTAEYTAKLEELQTRLEGARARAAEFIGPIEATTPALEGAAGATTQHADALTKLSSAELAAMEKRAAALESLAALKAGHEAILPSVARAASEFLALGASQGDVAAAFNLSAGAVKALNEELDRNTAMQRNRLAQVNAAVVAEFEAQQKLTRATAEGAEQMRLQGTASEVLRRGLAALDAARQAGIPTLAQEQVLLNAYTQALYDEAVALDQATQAQQANNAALAASNVLQETAQQYTGRFAPEAFPTGASLDRAGQRPGSFLGGASTGQMPQGSTSVLNTPWAALDRLADMFGNLSAFQRRSSIPGFAGGVENYSGGAAIVGERGPELVRLPRGSSVVPNHELMRAGGSGGAVTVNVSVSGVMLSNDPSARAALSNVIRDVLTRTLQQQRKLPSA